MVTSVRKTSATSLPGLNPAAIADVVEVAVAVAVAGLVAEAHVRLAPLSVGKSVKLSQCAGLPAPIDLDEGRRRVADLALAFRRIPAACFAT
ncbi:MULTISPECIES: hypothetical protein [unclassified Rhizobium]|uniref:hypothetical protein n=1 Tax=unclassified Rhizobium TaxID=2613769 RepID=UPI0027D35A43|nr:MULTISPECIES: hypothetical protein [unclassified Rhizobium]MDH7808629.1 hypothetical protein [Rhizobium sp. AN67]MDQ4408870.1 hypothetical protein [Rhizobium sp. AN63]